MPIGGYKPQDILIARFKVIFFQFLGSAFDTNQLGLRKSAAFTPEPEVQVATEGREFITGHMIKAPIELLQTTYLYVKMILFLMSRYNMQYQMEVSDGTWLNFVDDTDTSTPHVPNGSMVLAMMEPSFENTPKAISLKASLGGLLYNPNKDWMLAHTTKEAGGGSGATPSGATTLIYDPAQFSIAGFYDMLIGSAPAPTDSVGSRSNTKFSVKAYKQTADEQERDINTGLEFDIETDINQSILSNWAYIESFRNSDVYLTFPMRNGMTWKFAKSLSIVTLPEYTDEKTPLKVRIKGKVPFDNLIGGQSNFVFDDTNQVITCGLVGYSS